MIYSDYQSSKLGKDNIGFLTTIKGPYDVQRTPKKDRYSFYLSQLWDKREFGFEKDPWFYQINSDWYRGPEWEDQAAIVTAGCSFTFGQGSPIDIASVLRDIHQIYSVNLGIPGAAVALITKAALHYSRMFPTKGVIFMLPGPDRFYYAAERIDGRTAHYNANINIKDDRYMKILQALDDTALMGITVDAIDAAISELNSRNIPHMWSSWDPTGFRDDLKEIVGADLYFELPEFLDRGRDWAGPGTPGHAGPKTITSWAAKYAEISKGWDV